MRDGGLCLDAAAMTDRSNSIRRFALLVALFSASVDAAPRIPTSDSEVLERLPSETGLSSLRSVRAMHSLVAAEPENLDLAVRDARIQIDRARDESDPRQLGQAQAVLAPWWHLDEPPIPVLLLRATISERVHEFSSALDDLEQAVTRDPGNAQAWLTRATVQQVVGDLSGASASCQRLAAITQGLVAAACTASVDGVTGKASQAYVSLEHALSDVTSPNMDSPGVRAWATTMQAEIAERLGRREDAEALYRQSLLLDTRDAYTRAAFADFLIDEDRAEEVLTLIAVDTAFDDLLLRRALAAALVDDPTAATSRDDLAARYAASHARGDRVHLREQARFVLTIEKSPAQALQLALDNWAIQKEPIDARIVLEAAHAAGRADAAASVVGWIRTTGLEDVRLASLAEQVSVP